ncbi:DUF4097 family beta strand repeat-containing protein [Paraglaciecola aestuariivivens]
MKNTFKITFYLNAVLLYLLLFFSTSALAQTYSQNFAVKPGGKLNIQTDIGSISVATHDQATIDLQVEIENQSNNSFKFQPELTDGNLYIKGELEGQQRWGQSPKVKFTLVVPSSYHLDLNTSGGSLAIDDLNGDIKAKTSGGSIKVGNVTGNVSLHTSGGSIKTRTISGNLYAHTSGGSIKTTLDKQLTDDAKLTTSGGSITAFLRSDIKIDIDASTSGGRVKSDFEIVGKTKKRAVRGSINGGGPTLTLKTSGGNIKIKQI